MLADRYSQFAGCAADEAVKQSGLELPLEGDQGYRAACIIGSGIGGVSTMEYSYKMLFEEKKRATHPLTLLKTIGSSAAAHVSIEYGITGPVFWRRKCLFDGAAFHRSGVPDDSRGALRFRHRRRVRSLAELGHDARVAGHACPQPGRFVSRLQRAETARCWVRVRGPSGARGV